MSDKLREALAASGKVSEAELGGLSDKECKTLAKAFGVEVPRGEISLKEQFGGMYVQIPAIPYTNAEGEAKKSRHFSIRAECVDQLIEDLEAARELISTLQ